MEYPQQLFQGKTYRLYPRERYFSRGTKRLHRIVWMHHHGTIPRGHHIHHIDNNPHNNDISNLELKSSFTHHSEHMTEDRRDEMREWIEKIRPLAIAWHGSSEGIEWHKRHGRITWRTRQRVEKKCEMCGKLYETPFPTRSQYCHQNCKMKARRRRLAATHYQRL